MGKINLQALPFSVSFSLYFWGNLTPILMCYFLSLTAREIAKKRYVGTDISIVATAIVWTYIYIIFIAIGRLWKMFYASFDTSDFSSGLFFIVWDDRTHLCWVDIWQEWCWVPHNDTLGGICLEGGRLGATATSMQYAKMACGENFERWGWFGNMICCERYRRTESEIRCRMDIYTLVVRYMSSI